MILYCINHNERVGLGDWLLTKEAMKSYGNAKECKGFLYLSELSSYISELHLFFKSHKNCDVVINNEKGQQLWPEDIAEKEMSNNDRGIRNCSSKSGVSIPDTAKLLNNLNAKRFIKPIIEKLDLIHRR